MSLHSQVTFPVWSSPITLFKIIIFPYPRHAIVSFPELFFSLAHFTTQHTIYCLIMFCLTATYDLKWKGFLPFLFTTLSPAPGIKPSK